MARFTGPISENHLLSHINIWTIEVDQPRDPYLYEFTVEWLLDGGGVTVDLALTLEQVRELLAGTLDSEVEISESGSQRMVSYGDTAALPLDLEEVRLRSVRDLELVAQLKGTAGEDPFALELSLRMSYLCVFALDVETAAAVIKDCGPRLEGLEVEYDEDVDETVSLTVDFPDDGEPGQPDDSRDPPSQDPILLTDYQSLELSLTVNHENWCEEQREWLYAQSPSLYLGVDIRVDENSGEDGALAPSIDFSGLTDLPAWHDLRDFELNESSAEVEAWYGNDAPELTENVFRFLGDGGFEWRAKFEGRDFCCQGRLEKPSLTVMVKKTEDLDGLLRRAWPAQAERGISVKECQSVDYGPKFPANRRHWMRLTLELV